jgi:hypothetical protein
LTVSQTPSTLARNAAAVVGEPVTDLIRTNTLVRRGALVATAVALVLPAGPARAADVATTRLFFHSASGSYAEDALAGGLYSAPPGSTLSATGPLRAAAATARATGSPVPGAPWTPTWNLPVTGAVRSVCVDLYLSTTAFAPAPPSLNKTAYITLRLHVGGSAGSATTVSLNRNDFPDGIQRVTAFATTPAPVEVSPTTTVLSLHGLALNNPDWTLHYDSMAQPSSIRFNLPVAKCTVKSFPAPKPGTNR